MLCVDINTEGDIDMKEIELRLGNLIYWDIPEKEGVVHEVVGIRNRIPQTIPISLGDSIEDYKPIPITEEWLLNFGFKKDSEGYTLGRYSLYYNHKQDSGIYGQYYLGFQCGKDFNFIHQLQNSYFNVIGQELKLKDK